MVRSAPLLRARASFSSLDAAATTRAPSALPNSTAAMPTPPPAPSTNSEFPGAKAPEAAPGKGELFSFLVVPEGKGKSGVVSTALNVQALYHFNDGSEKLLSYLMFKKIAMRITVTIPSPVARSLN